MDGSHPCCERRNRRKKSVDAIAAIRYTASLFNQPNGDFIIDKGIRPHVNAKFVELLTQREQLGNKLFRKSVIADAMEQFGITLASAATHYNHAFKEARRTHAHLLTGLGRPEDKKGGRKPKAKPVETPATETPATETPATETPAADAAPTQEPATEPEQPAAEPEQPAETLFTVVRVKDGAEVATGLTQAQADELIARAKTAKKAALKIQ